MPEPNFDLQLTIWLHAAYNNLLLLILLRHNNNTSTQEQRLQPQLEMGPIWPSTISKCH